MTKTITKPKKTPARSAKTSAASNTSQPGETKRPVGKLGLILDRLKARKGIVRLTPIRLQLRF